MASQVSIKKTKKMQENLYTPDCIRTISGRYVNILAPTPDMIDINDIAHGLARQYRFGGHTKQPYTVLQHSMEAYLYCDKKNKLEGLLHDASEAYLGDIPSPIKRHLPEYKKIEHRFMEVIAKKYSFEYPLSEEVKAVDKHLTESEWLYFVLNNNNTKAKSEAEMIDLFLILFAKVAIQ